MAAEHCRRGLKARRRHIAAASGGALKKAYCTKRNDARDISLSSLIDVSVNEMSMKRGHALNRERRLYGADAARRRNPRALLLCNAV